MPDRTSRGGIRRPQSFWNRPDEYILYYAVILPILSPFLLKEYIWKTIQSARVDRRPLTEHEVRVQRQAEIETLYHKQRDTDKPPDLSTRRPRALTPPPPTTQYATELSSHALTSYVQVRRHYSLQLDSDLLAKLPTDIRLNIWELVISGYTIEVFRGHGHLLHRLRDEDAGDGDFGTLMPNLYEESPNTNLISILKTCRQIYTEAIRFLYSDNTFSLWQNDTLFDLRSTTLSHRFNTIRSVTIHWQFRDPATFRHDVCRAPWDVATWKKACQLLKSMSMLKALSVDIQGPFLTDSDILDMLQPLTKVRIERNSFRVRVPWPIVRIQRRDEGVNQRFEDQNFPFRIFRPADIKPDRDTGPHLIAY